MFNRIAKTVPNEKAAIQIADFNAFKNNSKSFRGEFYPEHNSDWTIKEGFGTYYIYTYDVCIVTIIVKDNMAAIDKIDETKYSRTSSRHMSEVKKGLAMANLSDLPASWLKELYKK